MSTRQYAAPIRHREMNQGRGWAKTANEFARDSKLKPRGKAVGIYLNSHSDGWETTTERIAQSTELSRKTVYEALNDLERCGYLRRKRVRASDGRLFTVAFEFGTQPGSWRKEPWLEGMEPWDGPDGEFAYWDEVEEVADIESVGSPVIRVKNTYIVREKNDHEGIGEKNTYITGEKNTYITGEKNTYIRRLSEEDQPKKTKKTKPPQSPLGDDGAPLAQPSSERQPESSLEVNPEPETQLALVEEPQPITSSQPPKAKKREPYSDEFERWWKVYPRHVGKKSAFRAWKAAIREGTDEGVLLAQAERFGVAMANLGREMRFIPHPTTWLNQGRWDDELEDVAAMQEVPQAGSARVLAHVEDVAIPEPVQWRVEDDDAFTDYVRAKLTDREWKAMRLQPRTLEQAFNAFAVVHPNLGGGAQQLKAAFLAALRVAAPQQIIRGAVLTAVQMRAHEREQKYIKSAVKWLQDEDWWIDPPMPFETLYESLPFLEKVKHPDHAKWLAEQEARWNQSGEQLPEVGYFSNM